jgi:hypothetical protein
MMHASPVPQRSRSVHAHFVRVVFDPMSFASLTACTAFQAHIRTFRVADVGRCTKILELNSPIWPSAIPRTISLMNSHRLRSFESLRPGIVFARFY